MDKSHQRHYEREVVQRMDNNNNNNEDRNWLSVLTFDEFDLEEVYTNTGSRDIITTLTQQGYRPEVSMGMASFIEEVDPEGTTNTSSVVSLNDIMQRGLQGRQEAQRVSLSDMGRGRVNVDNQTTEEAEDGSELFRGLEGLEDSEETVIQPIPTEWATAPEDIQPTVRNTTQHEGDGEDNMENENNVEQVSLRDLFARQTSLSDLDNERRVSMDNLAESEASNTYSRPDMSQLQEGDRPIVEFGEDVLIGRKEIRGNNIVGFSRKGYEDFNNESVDEYNEEQALERQRRSAMLTQRESNIKDIIEAMFGERYHEMYGYDTVGRYDDGRPYMKSVLSTRFGSLYDRRFRKEEEMRSNSRNVAVANRNPSVKSFIELEIKGEQNGDLVAHVKDSDGERIQYLEDKLQWLQSSGYTPPYWVLGLKTQFEFEEEIRTLEQLKTLVFPRY